MKIYFLILLIILTSCSTTPRKSGVDKKGDVISCVPLKTDNHCSKESQDLTRYPIECPRQGGEVVQCGCNEWICVLPGKK